MPSLNDEITIASATEYNAHILAKETARSRKTTGTDAGEPKRPLMRPTSS
jgi:hypothetical protein